MGRRNAFSVRGQIRNRLGQVLQLHPCLKINNAPSSGTKKLQNVTVLTDALSRFCQHSSGRWP